jgi:hypothetical protein
MAKDPKNRDAEIDLNNPEKTPGTGISPEEDQPSSKTQSERADELAEDAIDELSDDRASNADLKNRKSQLIDGPAEFRKARRDNE